MNKVAQIYSIPEIHGFNENIPPTKLKKLLKEDGFAFPRLQEKIAKNTFNVDFAIIEFFTLVRKKMLPQKTIFQIFSAGGEINSFELIALELPHY